MFGSISRELDLRHDKRERIVKISRDICIESKRIIFALHRIKNEEDKPAVMAEAAKRFTALRAGLWLQLATELIGEEPAQYMRAYSGGLQEWVEALSFYHFLRTDRLVTWAETEGELQWREGRWGGRPERPGVAHWDPPKREEAAPDVKEVEEKVAEVGIAESKENKDAEEMAVEMEAAPVGASGQEEPSEDSETKEREELKEGEEKVKEREERDRAEREEREREERKKREESKEREREKAELLDGPEGDFISVSVAVPQSEYVLGLADLTGELMRNAINSLATGNTEACFSLLAVLQEFCDGFNRLDRKDAPRDLNAKVKVLKQSLRKVEQACYSIQVRGSEIPKNHLADIFTSERRDIFTDGEGGGRGEEEDLGYFD